MTTHGSHCTLMFRADTEVVDEFTDNVRYLWSPNSLEAHEKRPDHFLRDFVALNKPCLFQNDEIASVSLDELVSAHGDCDLVVDVSPDGHADIVRQCHDGIRRFVKPASQHMSLAELRERLRLQETKRKESYEQILSKSFPLQPRTMEAKTNDFETVCYYSRQNDCLRKELPAVAPLFPSSLSWASETFGTELQAINLWIGNQRSVSSMHKDHFENLLHVVQGRKIVTLCPPADIPFLYEKPFASGQFCHQGGQWFVEKEEDSVYWIAADVSHEINYTDYPLLKRANPIVVHVPAGHTLYVPALWFHKVTQDRETVAVNYWYDMRFDSPLWTCFRLLQQCEATETENVSESQQELDRD